jgi:hypothetical protein
MRTKNAMAYKEIRLDFLKAQCEHVFAIAILDNCKFINDC